MPKIPDVNKAKRGNRFLERQLEDLLFTYPYLLDPGFTRLKRQRFLNASSRLDLLAETEEGAVVIELKHGRCGVAEVRQLERYLGLQESRSACVRGILVGSALTMAATKLCESSRFPIIFKRTGVDVPTRVVVCRECRRARSAHQERCPQDGSHRVLA